MTSRMSPEFTVFISHAGEDKATIAIPLREKLGCHGITAFVDEADMPPGTHAESAMIAAMETAELAVIVLSPEFVARKWPMKELFCFLRRREQTAKRDRNPRPVTIPFFYRLSVAELYEEPKLDRVNSNGESIYFKSRFLERMNAGEPEADIGQIKEALRKIHGIMGVRNDLDATNDSSYLMLERRELLLRKLCEKVREALPHASRNRPPASGSGDGQGQDEEATFEDFCNTPTASDSGDRKEHDDFAERMEQISARIGQLKVYPPEYYAAEAKAKLVLERLGR